MNFLNEKFDNDQRSQRRRLTKARACMSSTSRRLACGHRRSSSLPRVAKPACTFLFGDIWKTECASSSSFSQRQSGLLRDINRNNDGRELKSNRRRTQRLRRGNTECLCDLLGIPLLPSAVICNEA